MNMIRILHASDLHGLVSRLWSQPGMKYDMVILTGDMLPNWRRGPDGGREAERQRQWLLRKEKQKHPGHRLDMMMREFDERPVIVVDGNHDFMELGEFMLAHGHTNVHPIRLGEVIELFGHDFTGFPHIPYIAGEWNNEARVPELHDYSDIVMSLDPTILVMHSPPAGFLDRDWETL